MSPSYLVAIKKQARPTSWSFEIEMGREPRKRSRTLIQRNKDSA